MSLLNSLKYIEIINNTTRKIEKNEIKLNNLNVFPVADGDTGTNVLLTLLDGKKVIKQYSVTQFKGDNFKLRQKTIAGLKRQLGCDACSIFQGIR